MEKSFYFGVSCRFPNNPRYFTKETFENLEEAKLFADALSVCSMYSEVIVVRYDVEPVYIAKDYAGE